MWLTIYFQLLYPAIYIIYLTNCFLVFESCLFLAGMLSAGRLISVSDVVSYYTVSAMKPFCKSQVDENSGLYASALSNYASLTSSAFLARCLIPFPGREEILWDVAEFIISPDKWCYLHRLRFNGSSILIVC